MATMGTSPQPAATSPWANRNLLDHAELAVLDARHQHGPTTAISVSKSTGQIGSVAHTPNDPRPTVRMTAKRSIAKTKKQKNEHNFSHSRKQTKAVAWLVPFRLGLTFVFIQRAT
jgi:hypothetical protein